MPLRRKRRLGRPLTRRAQGPADPPGTIPVPGEGPAKHESTVVEGVLIDVPPRPASQAETAQLPSIPRQADPNEATAGTTDAPALEPAPPSKIQFLCPCGARLVANREIYDKRMRCHTCQEMVLVTLVFYPAKHAFGIQPLRAGKLPDLEA